jgi:hypothetical protein
MISTSEETKKIYRWMEEHLGFNNAELLKAFPNRKDNSLRAIKSQYGKAVKSGKWPEAKRGQKPIESTDSVQPADEA